MNRVTPLLLGLAALSACQTYDFERVVPLAVAQTTDKTIVQSKRLKPNVMLLVDNSGSMNSLIDAANPGGPTRISEMKNAMATLLQGSGTIARLGVTIFPTNEVCAAANAIDVALPAPSATDTGTDAALTQTAQQVNAKIQALVPKGGTPTGTSLEFLGNYPGLNDSTDLREDFVLLLTDGLPNCNENNPTAQCAAPNPACICTVGSGNACSGTYCALGCLDRDGSVAKVRDLRQKGIKTIVVGFGADLAGGQGQDVLNAMAVAGEFPRQCPNGTDAECGANNRCITATKLCERAFFQAANGTELADALRKIWDSLSGDPCVYQLSATPSDPRFLSVIVDGQSQVAGAQTFAYDSGRNEVTFLGDTCSKLKASSTSNPVTVEFRIVEQL